MILTSKRNFFRLAEEKIWLLDQTVAYREIRGEGGSGCAEPDYETTIEAVIYKGFICFVISNLGSTIITNSFIPFIIPNELA